MKTAGEETKKWLITVFYSSCKWIKLKDYLKVLCLIRGGVSKKLVKCFNWTTGTGLRMHTISSTWCSCLHPAAWDYWPQIQNENSDTLSEFGLRLIRKWNNFSKSQYQSVITLFPLTHLCCFLQKDEKVCKIALAPSLSLPLIQSHT